MPRRQQTDKDDSEASDIELGSQDSDVSLTEEQIAELLDPDYEDGAGDEQLEEGEIDLEEVEAWEEPVLKPIRKTVYEYPKTTVPKPSSPPKAKKTKLELVAAKAKFSKPPPPPKKQSTVNALKASAPPVAKLSKLNKKLR